MSTQDLKTPKGANRSLWIMGLSIILVLYVHTSLSHALPIMAEDFGVDYSLVTWVLTAYLVSGAAVTIIIGRLADIYGAKKMLLVVFICYIVGVILAPFAQEFYTLIGLRILQGVAVALVPVSVRIARDLFPPARFPFAQGMILSMYQGGSAVGLVLGAAVVFFAGCEGVFLSAIPFALLFLFLLWKFIPKVVEEKVVKDTWSNNSYTNRKYVHVKYHFSWWGNRPVNWIILDFLGYRNRINCGVLCHRKEKQNSAC